MDTNTTNPIDDIPPQMPLPVEHKRLNEYHHRDSNWKKWGPYLSERAWGTVREDYSADSNAWDYFPHDHARSRTYRWNEDGLAGISDRDQFLCFALALWNGKDPILKERLFGLNNAEGNHGEDVKEVYFYLDSTPTHSYMKMLYRYPHAAYPYEQLLRENRARGLHEAEYELNDTGVLDDNRFFDVLVEYAKADQNDMFIKVSVTNMAETSATLHFLPTLWFRNTWSWGYPEGPLNDVKGKPRLHRTDSTVVQADHPTAGTYYWYADDAQELLFTENESNNQRLFGVANRQPYVKDAFHRYIIEGDQAAVNPAHEGTKAAALYQRELAGGETMIFRLRLSQTLTAQPFDDFDTIVAQRIEEGNKFYKVVQNPNLNEEERHIQRQAFAGMLWSKQLYYYDMAQWLRGDPASPEPPDSRDNGRNHEWIHLHNFDLISVPDKWEYPWYASWDLAFHCIPFALIDPDFAKRQMLVMTREWYMHPSGQFPAYEWAFSDVNPPVQAWAAWRVYQIDAKATGKRDTRFLQRVFHKLLLNFTWWVNQKDFDERNIFQGGFLGLDNISLFDRSKTLPNGSRLDQSDGTAWMAFYSVTMMKIALELAQSEITYQDLASKFYEHFLAIARAMTNCGGGDYSLWDEEDGFFYDLIHLSDGDIYRLKIRSLVGLIPLLAVETLEPNLLAEMSDFTRRMQWFTRNRSDMSENMASVEVQGEGHRVLTAILTKERLVRVLGYLLDENEFLSPYGIRSLSKFHADNPETLTIGDEKYSIQYEPAESTSKMLGGNSNWRGPVWFPINFVLIEALQRFHHYYGDSLKVECPTGSGNWVTLAEVATDLSQRLTRLFLKDEAGKRPFRGNPPPNADYILFHEYFHGDTGEGLGASHQTGWTGLVAKLIQQSGGRRQAAP